MKVLLTAVNAKYIHSSLAVYDLRAYAETYGTGGAQVEIAEPYDRLHIGRNL